MFYNSSRIKQMITRGITLPNGETVPLIEHMDPEQVADMDSESTARMEGGVYDLRADKFYRKHPTKSGPTYIGVHRRNTPVLQPVSPEPEPGTKRPLVYAIPPHEGWWIRSVEWVNMPDDLKAFINMRSTDFRGGGNLCCTTVEPGYCGFLTMFMFNYLDSPMYIEQGARVAKIAFTPMIDAEPNPYDGVWQHGRVSTEGQDERPY